MNINKDKPYVDFEFCWTTDTDAHISWAAIGILGGIADSHDDSGRKV